MIPNNVARSPYFSRSAFVVYNRASSSSDKGADIVIDRLQQMVRVVVRSKTRVDVAPSWNVTHLNSKVPENVDEQCISSNSDPIESRRDGAIVVVVDGGGVGGGRWRTQRRPVGQFEDTCRTSNTCALPDLSKHSIVH